MLSLNFSPFPELATDRLLLKSLNLADAEAVFNLRSNPVVMHYINRPLTTTLQEAEEWISLVLSRLESAEGITWGIFLKEEPSANVGNIGLWRIEKENYRAEIGYMLKPSLQGKGIMLEALRRIIDYGFGDMQLHSIEAQLNPANTASANLLKKAGFIKEADLKENIFWNGKFEDTAIYSMLTR